MSDQLSRREKAILQDAKEWINGDGAICQYCPYNFEGGCVEESGICGIVGKLFDEYIDNYDINRHPGVKSTDGKVLS